jgi:hypothetical protein
MKYPAMAVLLVGACSSPATKLADQDANSQPVVDAAANASGPDLGSTPIDVAPAAVDSVSQSDATSTPPAPAGWWDARWTRRSKVTVSDPALKEDLQDFQVAVRLEAAGIDYAEARGDDLRFIDASGKVLSHQIDTWAPGGPSLIWLRLPRLGSAPTVLWMYYGNKEAPALAASEVWPAPYTGVWHLSGDAKDSTANAFDGMDMAGGAFAEGKLGKGLQLDGAKRDHITLKNDIKLVAGAAGCTFAAWINPTKIENSVNGMIIMTVGKWFNNNHNSFTDFNINAAGQMISHVDPGANTAASGYARILSDPGFIKTNEWAWVTYVIDLAAKEERFFKNGMLVSTKPPPAGKAWAATFIDMVSSRVVIGAEEDVVSHWYTGSMDELRIEKGMRSAAWIAAQYRAMTATGYVTVAREK